MVSSSLYASGQVATGLSGAASVSSTFAGYNSSVSEALQKFFSKPRLEVSLAKVVTSEDRKKALKNYLIPLPAEEIRYQHPFRMQGYHVIAHRGEIKACKAKLTVQGETAGYLIWDTVEPGRDTATTTRNLLPEEDEILVIWRADKVEDRESFAFNTADRIFYDLKKVNFPLTFEITFLSDTGLLNKKPYRYKMTLTPWERIEAREVKA